MRFNSEKTEQSAEVQLLPDCKGRALREGVGREETYSGEVSIRFSG